MEPLWLIGASKIWSRPGFSEIKPLLEAVASSRFITKSKSKELSRKLTDFTSANQRTQIIRHMYTTGRVKPDNENIFY